ncbi:MAG: type 2 isopentenyl-diphosphate Delta-isomerase [Limosilactobacillus sp.]|uniref:type 2 isopentenyl-diphosphate Delta-isomerase n=1 Tax=Limosilactobacillus sp. TaxID=2773925 RepID=UPI0026F7DA30|nr:type 2 isopentenyl-diphosphate Delta-isomerase [Limosilactobacillus sp.]
MESQQAQRKNEHLSLATKYYDRAHAGHPFDLVRLIHSALPESSVNEVDLTTELTPELKMSAPFYIEAMTGGSKKAADVNTQLARLAHKYNLAMATGSVSVALKEDSAKDSFAAVRAENPDGIVLANLSANATPEQARAAVELLGANAIEIHVNVAQELVMPEGDRSFYWVDNIKRLVDELDVPVIVKEVGFGMNKTDIMKLNQLGVKVINVSGHGGTNFVMIENARNHEEDYSDLFNWGQTTPEALLEARLAGTDSKIIASGGICSPLDVIKAGVLGASAVGVAGYFLNVLIKDGYDALDQTISDWMTTLPRLMTLVGCRRFSELREVDYILGPELQNYLDQRQ